MLEFTAVFPKVSEGYIGYFEELPGANTQGATLEEARENLREAIQLVVEANRELREALTRHTSTAQHAEPRRCRGSQRH
jgi:predicted RNase H-like HicB family nuclease